LRGGPKRTPDDGLVNVANARPMLVEQRQRFRRVPGAVADFDGQRVIAKTQQHRGKIRHRFLGAMEGKRELQQDRSELACGAQHVKAGPDGALVVRAGAGSSRSDVVCEALPELCGEEETRIAGYEIDSLLGVRRLERTGKRGRWSKYSGWQRSFTFARRHAGFRLVLIYLLLLVLIFIVYAPDPFYWPAE